MVKRISVLLRRGAEQLGQLGHLDGDTPGLVAREQIGSVRRPGSVSGVRQWLPVVVSDNEAGAVVFDVPRRREAARWASAPTLLRLPVWRLGHLGS